MQIGCKYNANRCLLVGSPPPGQFCIWTVERTVSYLFLLCLKSGQLSWERKNGSGKESPFRAQAARQAVLIEKLKILIG